MGSVKATVDGGWVESSLEKHLYYFLHNIEGRGSLRAVD